MPEITNDNPWIDRIRASVADFLQNSEVELSSLVLDGPGVNGAVQYAALSALGIDRLKKLKQVHIISASTYAYLFFLAHCNGSLTWNSEDLKQWDSFNRRSHDMDSLGLIRHLCTMIFSRRSALLTTRGFSKALEGTVDNNFFNNKISDLPDNVVFWLFDEKAKSLVKITPKNEYAEMRLDDLIQSAPSVPRLFLPYIYREAEFSDPIYSSSRKDLYKTITTEVKGNPCLFVNIYRNSNRSNIKYLKSHDYADSMLVSDMMHFLLNIPNSRIYQSIESGLFQCRRVD